MKDLKKAKQGRLMAFALALLLTFSFFVNVPSYAFTEVTSSTVNYASYVFDSVPRGLNITFYSDIYSRGFSWMTDTSTDGTELYIVESSAGADADFSIAGAAVPVENLSNTQLKDNSSKQSYNLHKAHVTGLDAGKTYSYKLGSSQGGYKYGVFSVESDTLSSIDVLMLSDAQTRVGALLSKWENSVKAAFSTVTDPDFVLYGGDQFDASMNNPQSDNNIGYSLRYGFSRDTVDSYIGSLPYMACMGNHDNTRLSIVDTSDINFANGNTDGYYSFNYGFTHFVVLRCVGNGESSSVVQNEQNWLRTDLAAANNNPNINWIVVLMHNGPHSTGDHSADSFSRTISSTFTPIFSEYHVDLVLQGHDHTYSKTLPYKWDTEGKTTTYGNTSIVNYSVVTETVDGITYDINPNGTYYVTTGAAGHRAGATAGEIVGVYADVVVDNNAADGSGLSPVDPSQTYLNNQYKTIVGTCNVGCSIGTSTVNKGDPATCNVDGQMFGALSLTEDTLSYKFYVVDGGNVKLLDTLNVMKLSVDEAQVLETDPGQENASAIKSLISALIDKIAQLADFVVSKLRELVDSIASVLEGDREADIDSANAGSAVKVQLQSVQASEASGGKFNLRLIAGTKASKEELPTVGFYVYKDTGSGFGEANELKCSAVYTDKVDADTSGGFANEKTVSSMDGGNLYALTITQIDAVGNIKLKIVPFGKNSDQEAVTGNAFIIELQDGFVKAVTLATAG